jgi:hypothetical protein
MLGASPAFGVPKARKPESDTAARRGRRILRRGEPTFSAVMAPADDPPIAMRSVSIPYVAAFVRRNPHRGLGVLQGLADRGDAQGDGASPQCSPAARAGR